MIELIGVELPLQPHRKGLKIIIFTLMASLRL